jgi:hypothetical protein
MLKEVVDFLLIRSKFSTPTCFGIWLPSSGGRECLISYSINVLCYRHVRIMTRINNVLTLSLLMSYIYGAPSKARNLTSYIYGRDFLLKILLLEPRISLIYAWKTNKYTNYSFSLLIMVAPTCFGIKLPSSGSVPSAFWEILNWGAVDRILWMGVLCLVAWCIKHTTPLNTTLNDTIFYRLLLNWASLRRH